MTDETTEVHGPEAIFSRAVVLCPNCEEQHLIGLVQDGARIAILNPTADEDMGDLLSDFMGDKMRAKLRDAFGVGGCGA